MAETDEFDPLPGAVTNLGQNIRQILAPNPSPMTFKGTNTYLLGDKDLAVIDPGPMNSAHLTAILDALAPKQRISHILVTHSHRDHSPLAPVLAQETGARVCAYGPSKAGRSAIMQRLAAAGLSDSGEGVDAEFTPDVELEDGESLEIGDGLIKAHWTPGHLGNHMCFQYGDAMFTGDLVMGWASSLVSPPDGDLSDFMASCRKLQTLNATAFHPGHGAPITQPQARLDWLISHRQSREAAILQRLQDGPSTVTMLARAIYTDTPEKLMPAATRNVLAHLIDLYSKNTIETANELSETARFELV